MKTKIFSMIFGLAFLTLLTSSNLEARCHSHFSVGINAGCCGPAPMVYQPAYVVGGPCYAQPVVYGAPYYQPVYVAPSPVVVAPSYPVPVNSAGISFGWCSR